MFVQDSLTCSLVACESHQPSAISLKSLTKPSKDCLNRLLAFHSRVGLASEIGGGTFGTGEEAGEQWLEEGAEDDLSAVRHGEGHPKDQDELEDVIES
jgi:hypothetical protein